MYNILIPQLTKMLKNLDRVLDKGADYSAAKKFEMDVLLNSRLAPDQFPLLRQVQIACDTAKLGASRLTGKEAPTHADTEKTLPELKKRIQETISYLETFTKDDFNGSEERKISQPRWEGKYLHGFEYAVQHVLPNLYFHITTTYSILRNNGVDVGKKDYLGEMPYKK
jgi:uncharacterized protein